MRFDNTLTTSYTYDWMNHVSGVTMTRPSMAYTWNATSMMWTCIESGTPPPVTQTRTFVYSDAGLLTSATNPENGTVSYTYNSTNTLHSKQDANGQTFVYSYDTSNRVIEVQKYPTGRTPPYGEDVCARVNYVYGSQMPVYGDTYGYTYGRLMSASTLQSGCASGAPAYTESYTYTGPGSVLSKTVNLGNYGFTATVGYTYDSYGRRTAVQYPFYTDPNGGTDPMTFTTVLDAMGRPSTMSDSAGKSWVQSTGYDYAGRLVSFDDTVGGETRSYNTLGQLVEISSNTYYQPSIQYVYSATHNNGQITQAIQTSEGNSAIINYAYDSLKRVTSAITSPTGSGYTYSPSYSEAFSYDGFGNLTSKILNGTTQTIGVNAGNNRLNPGSYDANGNLLSGAGTTMTYNEDNKMSSAAVSGGGIEYYYYGPDGKRMFRQTVGGIGQFTLWGAYGEQLGTYSGGQGACCNPQEMSVYFGNRLIWQDSPGFADYQPPLGYMGNLPGFVLPDRLGSNAGGGMMYPYGETPGVGGTDQVEFATYTRDSYTGFDNAVNRYYSSYDGRFNTPDPYVAGGAAKGSVNNPASPGSWNRYAYTRGDPVNRYDPTGTCDITTYSTSPDGTIIVDCTDFINNFFFGLQQYVGGWGSSTYFTSTASAAVANAAANAQATAQCLNNVAAADARNLSTVQSMLAGITTISDIASIALNASLSAVAGYQAASVVIVAGTVATFSEALTVGALAAAAAYSGLTLAGIPEEAVLGAAEKVFDGLATTALGQLASAQFAGCYSQEGAQ